MGCLWRAGAAACAVVRALGQRPRCVLSRGTQARTAHLAYLTPLVASLPVLCTQALIHTEPCHRTHVDTHGEVLQAERAVMYTQATSLPTPRVDAPPPPHLLHTQTTYERVKEEVLQAERAVLYTLGFDLKLTHPYKVRHSTAGGNRWGCTAREGYDRAQHAQAAHGPWPDGMVLGPGPLVGTGASVGRCWKCDADAGARA